MLVLTLSPAMSVAATFSPSPEEAALLTESQQGAKLDLSALTPQTEAGRSFFEIDDMRYPAADVQLNNALIGNLWPGGVLYYQFDSAVVTAHRSAWRSAAAAWSAVAPVTFVESTGQGNYVRVQNSSGNDSYVGMIGGSQVMNISAWTARYVMAHEIGHALGLIHEHSRANRNTYVNILYSNIQTGQAPNFDVESGSVSYGPYDFDSVMHYTSTAFSRNGQNTIEPRPAYLSYLYSMGQIDHLSTQDIAGMVHRYDGGGGPSNNNFASRRVLAGRVGNITGSNVGATSEAGEPPIGGGASVWYSWTAPVGGSTTIDTVGSNFDTVLAVYTGSSLSGLSLVGVNDDSGGTQSRVIFEAVAGLTYQIAVDGYSGATGNIVLNWTGAPVPEADFNHNGTTDILLQNNSTGERLLWYMQGTVFTGNGFISTVATEWSIVGTDDFNRDGNADILFQDYATRKIVVWYMNGVSRISSAYLPDLPSNWSIAGTNDVNGDGKPDLVLENLANGQRAVWLMNGVTRTSSFYLPSTPVEWKIVGIGDFNGDGKTDLVFQNYSTQRAAIWYLNGTGFSSSAYLPTSLGSWKIAGAGDFNQNGGPDLILQNPSTGERSIWLLNGLTVTSAVSLPSADVRWDIRNR